MLILKLLATVLHEFVKIYREIDEKTVDIVDESVHSFSTTDPIKEPSGIIAGSPIGFNRRIINGS